MDDEVLIAGTDSGVFTDTSETGLPGDVEIEAGSVQLADGGAISAKSTGVANAGSITISVHDTFESENGSVTTEAAQAGAGTAEGGNINITAPDIRLTRLDVGSVRLQLAEFGETGRFQLHVHDREGNAMAAVDTLADEPSVGLTYPNGDRRFEMTVKDGTPWLLVYESDDSKGCAVNLRDVWQERLAARAAEEGGLE